MFWQKVLTRFYLIAQVCFLTNVNAQRLRKSIIDNVLFVIDNDNDLFFKYCCDIIDMQ